MFQWTASGLKWLVRLKALTENRSDYFGLTLKSFHTRASAERKFGKWVTLGMPT